MKRTDVFCGVIACLLVLLMATAIAIHPCLAIDTEAEEKAVAAAAEDYMRNWVIRGFSTAYKDISTTVELGAVTVNVPAVTVEALVSVTMTLKDVSVGAMPAVQSMLSQLGLKEYDPSVSLVTQLPASSQNWTPQQLGQAEAKLKSWYRELSGYINQPFTGNLPLTLKAKLLPDGHLDESTFQLLINDGGDLVSAASILPRSDTQCRADGAMIMQEALTGNSAPTPTVQNSASVPAGTLLVSHHGTSPDSYQQLPESMNAPSANTAPLPCWYPERCKDLLVRESQSI